MTLVVQEVPVTQSTVEQEVSKQYREEAAGLKHDQDLMLKQKYGLVAPVLTLSETNLIRREERFGGR